MGCQVRGSWVGENRRGWFRTGLGLRYLGHGNDDPLPWYLPGLHGRAEVDHGHENGPPRLQAPW